LRRLDADFREVLHAVRTLDSTGLLQRDYYNYIYRGGTLRSSDPNKPVGPAAKTDTGRPVYGGGGITPDEPVKRQLLTTVQFRLRDPIFFFARDVAIGHVAGFDKYKVDRAIEFAIPSRPRISNHRRNL